MFEQAALQQIEKKAIEDTGKKVAENLSKLEFKSEVKCRSDGCFVKENIEQREQIEQREIINDYLDKLVSYSEYPETIKKSSIDMESFERKPPEIVKEKKEEFHDIKNNLIKEWERINGVQWPRYEEDVVVQLKSGGVKVIRKAGDRYDAHHIVPLSMGGDNIATNITPLRADIHEDHRGIHSKEGVYGKLEKVIGGK